MNGKISLLRQAKNRKDVEELDAEICEGLEIVYAESMKDVLETALVQSPEAEA